MSACGRVGSLRFNDLESSSQQTAATLGNSMKTFSFDDMGIAKIFADFSLSIPPPISAIMRGQMKRLNNSFQILKLHIVAIPSISSELLWQSRTR